MNFHQLRVFYEVARAGGFSTAAARLYLTQPAVSRQVKNLEETYDLKLFERMAKKIRPTEEGRTLLAFADQIFNLARQAEEALADFKGLSRGTLRVDSTFTFGDYYLSGLLGSFHERHPRIVIQVHTGNTSQVIENTLAHRNDVAFVAYDPGNDRLEAREIISDLLVAVVSPGHPLARRKSISLKELQAAPLILREPGSSPRRMVDETLARGGFTPRVIMESASTLAIKQMAARGFGMAILSQQVVANELRAGSLVQLLLRDADIAYRFYIIFHKGKYLSRTLQAFIDLAVAWSRQPGAEEGVIR